MEKELRRFSKTLFFGAASVARTISFNDVIRIYAKKNIFFQIEN